jgi:hypothetical protein
MDKILTDRQTTKELLLVCLSISFIYKPSLASVSVELALASLELLGLLVVMPGKNVGVCKGEKRFTSRFLLPKVEPMCSDWPTAMPAIMMVPKERFVKESIPPCEAINCTAG